jgi:hypothetical protein
MRQNQRLSSAEPLAFEGPAVKLAAPLRAPSGKKNSLVDVVRVLFFTRPDDF